ncbi:unnamed protein product [Mytilus edulis]|uniref:Uncharacterized protein n=1 Tax=Mytilus edulis TaxID=6550 RepID=A0A8S3V9G6_MYTED|nr:unnamed protein product [Mytilus edulis]
MASDITYPAFKMAGIEDNTDSASSTTSEMINTADTDKRLRTLTESGKELFENKQRKFLLKMQIVKSDLQLLARNIEPYSNELTSLQELKTEFMSGTVRYDTICKEYLDFLSRTNTAEGMDEVHKLSGEMQDFTQFVETEILARARAKAEAAKVKVHFAEKETLLLKEKALIEENKLIEAAKVERKKADIEADLDLLSRQKEAAAVEAEANALQNECDENMSQVLPDQPPLDSKSKTAAYINHVQKQISSIEIDKENTDAFHIDKENKHSTHIDQENTHVSGTLDPHANSFIPRKNIIADTHVSDNHPYPSDRTLATDFTHRISIFPLCTSELKIDEVRTLEVDESAYDKIGKDVFIRHGNPADLATRSIIPSKLENSIWLSGPVIKSYADQTIESFSLINPDTDNEIRPDITTRKTTSLEKLSLGSQRFERFGNWKSLVRSIALIKNFLVNRISKETRCQFRDAEMLVVGVVQNEIFSDEIDSRNSHITQISATSDKGSINTYVLPKKPIIPKTQEITGIKVEGSKMFCHHKEVKSVSIKEALKMLILFLAQYKKNPHITVLNETYDGHDSIEDVVALSRLFHHFASSTEAKQLSFFSIDSAARRYDHNQKTKLLLPTLTPRTACTEKKVITLRTANVMAANGMSFSHLRISYARDGRQPRNRRCSEREGCKWKSACYQIKEDSLCHIRLFQKFKTRCLMYFSMFAHPTVKVRFSKSPFGKMSESFPRLELNEDILLEGDNSIPPTKIYKSTDKSSDLQPYPKNLPRQKPAESYGNPAYAQHYQHYQQHPLRGSFALLQATRPLEKKTVLFSPASGHPTATPKHTRSSKAQPELHFSVIVNDKYLDTINDQFSTYFPDNDHIEYFLEQIQYFENCYSYEKFKGVD